MEGGFEASRLLARSAAPLAPIGPLFQFPFLLRGCPAINEKLARDKKKQLGASRDSWSCLRRGRGILGGHGHAGTSNATYPTPAMLPCHASSPSIQLALAFSLCWSFSPCPLVDRTRLTAAHPWHCRMLEWPGGVATPHGEMPSVASVICKALRIKAGVSPVGSSNPAARDNSVAL